MFIEMNPSNGGGGSSVKSGTTEAAAKNTDIVINTGVSNIKHFVWMAKVSGSNYMQTVEYNDDAFSNKYNAGCLGTSASTANTAFGTASQNTCMIASDTDLANGTIKIHTYNSNYGAVEAGIWMAE